MAKKLSVRTRRPDVPSKSVPISRWAAFVMLGAFAVGLNLYAAALASPFVFDDFTLPVGDPPQNLWAAVTGLRPFLMLTYWLNSSMSGNSTLGYHVFNLIIHAVNTGLVFLVLARLLAMSGSVNTRNIRIASVLGAAIFFIHPLQTESVSYVAGRSESLAAFFILLAYAVFLYRRHEAISWLETAIVLTLFGLGVSTKENAVCLVGMLVLTDVFWPRAFSTRGLRNNRKLYSAMAVGAALAAWKVLGVLAAAPSAGFSIHEATWYQYGFTQARAFFTYMRLAAIPIGLSIDHDFPVSHTILEHGAIVYLAALAGLLAACYALRRRYPLACFGLLLTLIILAPTSSIVPIRDPLAERRMYLPLVGLILIGYDVARHVRIPRRTGYAVCGVILAGFYILCYQRNLLWAEPAQLFVEAAPESTTGRAYVNLVKVLAEEHRCSAAVPYLRQAEARLPNNYMVELAWGRALECMGQPAQALNKMLRAARIWPSSDVYTLIGCLYGELGRQAQAGIALRKAVALDSRSDSARSALETWIKWTSQNPPIDHQRSPP